ncbi:SAM-dependent methyltransferase [Nonomuraea ferruginea]
MILPTESHDERQRCRRVGLVQGRHHCPALRAGVGLPAGREGPLPRRPRGRGDPAEAVPRLRHGRQAAAGVPGPRDPLLGGRGRDPAVPRHRHRPAHRSSNTHEIAQGIARESRVVYVDNDPDRAGARPRAAHQRARGRHRLSRRGRPRPRGDPGRGRRDARLQPTRRGHDAEHRRAGDRRRRPARHRRPPA